MDGAAANGHLAVVQYLHDHRSEGCTSDAMDKAAAQGHADVVRFVHTHRQEGCTTDAIDQAATNGHLEVVQYLHTNRHDGLTDAALAGAARNGHFEMVRFLCESCDALSVMQGPLDLLVVDLTVQRSMLELLQYLHSHRLLPPLTLRILMLVIREHKPLGMVTFFYDHFVARMPPEERTTFLRYAIERAAMCSRLDVLRFFDGVRREGEVYTTGAIELAAKDDDIDTAECLVRHGHQGRNTLLLDLAAKEGRLDLVQYLHETREDGCSAAAMTNAARNGHLDVVAFLAANRSEGCVRVAVRKADPHIADAVAALRCTCRHCTHGEVAPPPRPPPWDISFADY